MMFQFITLSPHFWYIVLIVYLFLFIYVHCVYLYENIQYIYIIE